MTKLLLPIMKMMMKINTLHLMRILNKLFRISSNSNMTKKKMMVMTIVINNTNKNKNSIRFSNKRWWLLLLIVLRLKLKLSLIQKLSKIKHTWSIVATRMMRSNMNKSQIMISRISRTQISDPVKIIKFKKSWSKKKILMMFINNLKTWIKTTNKGLPRIKMKKKITMKMIKILMKAITVLMTMK